MRVVVTGGAGFIGSNLCARLLATDGVHAWGSSYGLRGSVD